MENKENSAVIALDRVYELRLTHSALRRFSAITRLSMTELQDGIQRYDLLSTLLWVMLREEEPSMTEGQCDALIDKAMIEGRLTMLDIINAVAAAVTAAFGADEQSAESESEQTPPSAAGVYETL